MIHKTGICKYYYTLIIVFEYLATFTAYKFLLRVLGLYFNLWMYFSTVLMDHKGFNLNKISNQKLKLNNVCLSYIVPFPVSIHFTVIYLLVYGIPCFFVYGLWFYRLDRELHPSNPSFSPFENREYKIQQSVVEHIRRLYLNIITPKMQSSTVSFI